MLGYTSWTNKHTTLNMIPYYEKEDLNPQVWLIMIYYNYVRIMAIYYHLNYYGISGGNI